ncbi:AAT1 (YKL106W) [Zygosaccharomyces parabailii]|uniref:Aspartate aminotransferase n=1 Tax=Zygosaccharomyces bailii (strain CLIB 213 / ATCC 58445 / CBS 680 / BCRC 21525 / NBRC 1098 / NCYC 1416 / NRRL Y-2227) TaxID=1333698 RepID=A0A8J2T5M4_ZYGB2|nr:AAT1 (YKL106W) [Zygosaccharomyces parabailii]CDF89030.1 ZYBA0S03-07558g1_1 [Zygosaccharomyces bailii CLIB 213]
MSVRLPWFRHLTLIKNSVQLRSFSLFEEIPRAPPDKIFGLTEQFNKDENNKKVNLTVGVYKDNDGLVTTFPTVSKAQKMLEQDEKRNNDLSYLPIIGSPTYRRSVLDFLFRESCPSSGPKLLEENRISFVQTLSGTGALAVAADLLSLFISRTVWIPEPSWPNHINIFKRHGFTDIRTYPYYEDGKLCVDKWLEHLRKNVKKNDGIRHCIILHACCHNPTGLDPTREQWQKILETVNELKMLPIIDMAYQGLESGNPPEDAYVLRMCLDESRYKWSHGLFLCQSFAKNMGLYGERVGSLSVVVPPNQPETKTNIESQLKQIVRSIYSSPPGYGCRVASIVLSSPSLKKEWHKDVDFMVQRLLDVRHGMCERLGWSDLVNYTQQHGMFYYTRLNHHSLNRLRDEYSIYMTMDGRLSLSGINDHNIDYVCDAFKSISRVS